ncbi:tRNA uridine-5-carboxymethylaminomethyl(34) synthesis GTPase MnmE [Deferribacterales bacterium RsTz2092]
MAPLTPAQPAAVIVLRLSGDVLPLLKYLSLSASRLTPRKATRATFVSSYNPLITDDVLVVYYKAPNSYTGEDVLEVSFHGNPLIVNTAMMDFTNAGVRVAEAGEFTRRAYLNGKLTLTQAEGVNSIIRATTDVGVKAAGRVLYGELDTIFHDIRTSLIDSLAEVEAVIDFSEELDTPKHIELLARVEAVKERLIGLLDSYDGLKRAVNGVRVVIAGAPNAGKSTLFNKLLGKQRAIVSDEAGTTRDVLSEAINIQGLALSLSDTAGLRQSESAAEREGVRRAADEVVAADLTLILIDLNVQNVSRETLELVENSKAKVIVGTKADLERKSPYKTDVDISADDAGSLNKLKELLVSRARLLLPPDDTLPALLADSQRVECQLALEELGGINEYISLDKQAFHLRSAVGALDRTVSANVAEETLDKLFSKFCIGK